MHLGKTTTPRSCSDQSFQLSCSFHFSFSSLLFQPHSLELICPLLLVNLLKRSSCSANNLFSCRESSRPPSTEKYYSSKHISNWFAILTLREIQIKSLGLGFKCAPQVCCSQEWAKSRHGHKHPNNLTFGFEVGYFNFRCFDLNSDVLQNKMNCWLKNTLSQTRR